MNSQMSNGCPFKAADAKCANGLENKHKDMSEPPGPGGLPLIGQAFNLDTDQMHIQFMEWQKRFGDLFMFKVFGKHYLVVSHPDILRNMFVTCEHANRLNDRPASFMGKYVIERTKDIVFRKYDEQQQTLKMATMKYVENTLMDERWFYESVSDECADVVKALDLLRDSNVDIAEILDTFSAKIIGLLVSL